MKRRCICSRAPRSILVVSYGGIGDLLLMTPLLRSLKARYPNAPIDVYVQRGRDGILEGNPDVAQVFTASRRHGWRSYVDFFLRFSLRYDLAVSTRASDREVLFARAAGRRAISLVPPARGQDAWKRWVLSGYRVLRPGVHVVEEMLSLLPLVDVPAIRAWRTPRSPDAEAHLSEKLPFAWQTEPYAVLHLFPRNLYKAWTRDGWHEVAAYLGRRGLRTVVLGGGGSEEMARISHVLDGMPGDPTNLAGSTTFAEAAELLRRCAVYIGPDTAMTHLAVAAGAPTVEVARPTGLAQYAPYGHLNEEAATPVRIVAGRCACKPLEVGCSETSSVRGPCMESIRVEDILEAIEAIRRPALASTGFGRGANRFRQPALHG